MISRRSLLAGAALLLPARAGAQAVLTDDGLYRQPWFLDSFLELGPDLDEAADKGKRFAVMWELRGCPYCKDTHLVNFADPAIAAFVRERFEILQLNLIGAREVTDFDGEKLPEKRLAEKYGVRFTPTIQFFPERSDGLGGRKPREREVARGQGYLRPPQFRKLFAYVAERAYERGPLAEYLAQG
ncbi:MAG TPA: thioredoxin family protein [Beijerinckiaceae bacterium]|nr:thioredoxin family protein [Beijerinckiaceae bacterium]